MAAILLRDRGQGKPARSAHAESPGALLAMAVLGAGAPVGRVAAGPQRRLRDPLDDRVVARLEPGAPVRHDAAAALDLDQARDDVVLEGHMDLADGVARGALLRRDALDARVRKRDAGREQRHRDQPKRQALHVPAAVSVTVGAGASEPAAPIHRTTSPLLYVWRAGKRRTVPAGAAGMGTESPNSSNELRAIQNRRLVAA